MSYAERLTTLAVNNDGFVFDPSSGDSFVLNQAGLLILQRLQDGIDEGQVAVELTREFEVDEATASRDIADFLSLMKTMQLI